jgi:hypothetical protein
MMTPEDEAALEKAVVILEDPSLASRIAGFLGVPVEALLGSLPKRWNNLVNSAVLKSMNAALAVVATTFLDQDRTSSNALHKVACGISGAVGGFFGVIALPVELPLSTSVMLRSIADIARSEGEDISYPEPRLACLEVFAFGNTKRTRSGDTLETGYWATRTVLARTLSEAAQYIAERGLVGESAPPLVRFMAQVASRFGVTVSEKVAAQAVPVISAASGAAINLLFIDHFQDLARAHFTIRRLERKYGPMTPMIHQSWETSQMGLAKALIRSGIHTNGLRADSDIGPDTKLRRLATSGDRFIHRSDSYGANTGGGLILARLKCGTTRTDYSGDFSAASALVTRVYWMRDSSK